MKHTDRRIISLPNTRDLPGKNLTKAKMKTDGS